MIDPLRFLSAVRTLLRWRWPRRFVLRGTDVPIDLLHIVEREQETQCVIRLPDGSRMRIAPGDLGTRPVLASGAVMLACTLVLAGMVAALSVPNAVLEAAGVQGGACYLPH